MQVPVAFADLIVSTQHALVTAAGGAFSLDASWLGGPFNFIMMSERALLPEYWCCVPTSICCLRNAECRVTSARALVSVR